MEVQFQELIDKIKKEGVSAGQSQADEIVAKSKEEAAKIVADAKAQADALIKKAEEEIARKEKASEDAIKQAARNLTISFRDGITAELSALIKSETAKAFDSKLMEKTIPEVLKAMASDNDDLSVIVSEDVEKGLKAALNAEIAKGLTIKSSKDVNNGFRIGVNNGEAFYDFSAESVAEMFAAYLNPKVAALMKEAAK